MTLTPRANVTDDGENPGRRDPEVVQPGPERHCHSTLPLAVIGCHSLGVHTPILLPSMSLAVQMTVCGPWLAQPERAVAEFLHIVGHDVGRVAVVNAWPQALQSFGRHLVYFVRRITNVICKVASGWL